MKWQATNSFRYDVKFNFVSWNGILRLLCKIKLYFGTYLINLPFHLFHVSGNSCITLQKNYCQVRWKMKFEDYLATIYLKRKKIKIKTQMEYQIFFFNVGWCSCFWRDIYNCCLCEIFAIKNVLRVTSLIFYPISCNAKRCAICF